MSRILFDRKSALSKPDRIPVARRHEKGLRARARILLALCLLTLAGALLSGCASARGGAELWDNHYNPATGYPAVGAR